MATETGAWLRQRVYILMNAVDGGHQRLETWSTNRTGTR